MLRLYDTLTRWEREVFASDGERLRFYCCGPTVYGPAHIGNFRAFLVQDLFRRVVELGGLPTLHVRNLTDVDDKTIRESRAQGLSLGEFTAHWTERFHEDCAALHMLRPHVEPSAVGHIAEQIALIETLVEKGNAYVGKDGSVYFSVASFPGYGKLSHLDKREIRLGSAMSANDADEYEKDALADFALWKAHKEEDGENAWDSPWGRGRPGWHLACSAMGLKYLGESFDLHSGGVDLCFPHHENEIAQSEAATGAEFARHWFHVAHLTVDGTKMSKSLRNLYTLADIEAKGFSADELRYALLSGHYRQPLNFTFETLHAAKQALGRIRAAKIEFELIAEDVFQRSYKTLCGSDLFGPFHEAWAALEDDLNAPKALGYLFAELNRVEKIDLDKADALRYHDGLLFMAGAFGFQLQSIDHSKERPVPESIRALADARWAAKRQRDWAEADKLRDQIHEEGWEVKDGPNGYEVVRRQG